MKIDPRHRERETCYQCGKNAVGGLCQGCDMIPEECSCEDNATL